MEVKMSSSIPTVIDKCRGAMLATAIGDALGWPNEPRSKNRSNNKNVGQFIQWERSYNRPFWYNETIKKGEYSDDTQMMLAVARSVLLKNWKHHFINNELPFWLKYERGGGGALLRAARAYERSDSLLSPTYAHEYFYAGGNGVTMRILPHVIGFNGNNLNELMTDIQIDASLTHGHPRAFLGATCYAFILSYLMNKKSTLEFKELIEIALDGVDIWGQFLNEKAFSEWLNSSNQLCEYDFLATWIETKELMKHNLEFISNSLDKGLLSDDNEVLETIGCLGKENGAGDVAALASIYFVSKYANNPILGLTIPAYLKGADTDTVASITGGLLGMLCGEKWIPDGWKSVQDSDCILKMADLLCEKRVNNSLNDYEFSSDSDSSNILKVPIGRMRLVETTSIRNKEKGTVEIQKWISRIGQTIYVKEFQPVVKKKIISGQLSFPSLFEEKHETSDVVSERSGYAVSYERRIVLSVEDVAFLLASPVLNKKITVKKFFDIIHCLLASRIPDVKMIAKKYKVDPSIVELLLSRCTEKY